MMLLGLQTFTYLSVIRNITDFRSATVQADRQQLFMLDLTIKSD